MKQNWLAISLFLSVMIIIGAGPVDLTGKTAAGLTRAGVSGLCNLHLFANPATTEFLPSSAGAATPAFFTFDSPIFTEVSGGQGSLFWSADSGATIGAQGASATAAVLTTTGGSANGHGHMFFDGGSRTMFAHASITEEMGNVAPLGRCTTTVTAFGGGSCYPLCQETADCAAWGAGTCDTAIYDPDLWNATSCWPLAGRFDTANTAVIYCFEP